MKNIITVFKREINAYFNSSIAYIFIAVFLIISAGLFMTQFFLISNADMRAFFFILPIILCIFIPAVSMRLWSEDRRGNTLELLLTFPMNTYELVLGKFLASLLFYIIALLSTITIPIMLVTLGRPDVGVIFCQYIGSILVGGLFLSIGIFVSGFTKDQIVSFIVSMIVCFGLFFLGTDFTASSIDGWIPGLGSFLRNSIAMTPHYNTFEKGVFDISDFLYFVIGTFIFLMLNAFWLESRLRPKTKSIFSTACLLSFGIFALINVLMADVPIGRFDWTDNKTYTISKATQEILRDLKAPVIIKLFISPQNKMPTGMKTLERDLRDKLDEIRAVSKGKFNYKVFHMEAAKVAEKTPSLEKSIERKGIRPFQVQSIEADELGVKLVYSAISIGYKEKQEEIIPQVTPKLLPNLEYILISKIYKMTLDRTPVVALFAPYKEKALDANTKQILKMLGQRGIESFLEDKYKFVPRLLEYEGYRVHRIRITKNEPIPEDTDTLVVIDPEGLNDRQRFEINKFLVNGGSVFLAAQNYDFNFYPIGMRGIEIRALNKNPGVNPLLKEWGLGLNRDFLMDTQLEVLSLTGGGVFDLFGITQPVKTPLQIKIVPEQMNKNLSITSNLSSLFYLWGSALDIDEDKIEQLNLESHILFTSSPESWTVPYHYGSLTREDMTPPVYSKRKKFPLAIFVSGEFPDAFKNKPIPMWPEDKEAEEASYEVAEDKEFSPQPGKLILVGCAQMFNKDLFLSGGHTRFFINSIDAITLGEKLIGVRSKTAIDRSIPKISSIAKAWWRIFTIVVVPAILCIIWASRILLRRQAKQQYLRSIA